MAKVSFTSLPISQAFGTLSGRSSQRSVPGVGEKAYIGPAAEGGVQAGAVSGEAFYIVHLNPAPNDHQVIDLLRAVVARSHGK